MLEAEERGAAPLNEVWIPASAGMTEHLHLRHPGEGVRLKAGGQASDGENSIVEES